MPKESSAPWISYSTISIAHAIPVRLPSGACFDGGCDGSNDVSFIASGILRWGVTSSLWNSTMLYVVGTQGTPGHMNAHPTLPYYQRPALNQ